MKVKLKYPDIRENYAKELDRVDEIYEKIIEGEYSI